MIISDEKEFIFIHNPKCGGTTVRDSLKRFDTHAHWYWGQTKINDITIDKAHMSLSILRMHFPEAFKLMSKYFVFGVVRNPYKRVISSYNEVFFKEFENVMNGSESFDAYKVRLNDFIAKMSAEQIKGWTQSHRHFILQKNMFYVGRKCYADLILKLEDYKSLQPILMQ